MKIRTLTPIAIFLCLLVLSCGKSEQSKSLQDETGKLKIAVIPKATTHEFWKAIHAGAVRASRELEVEIFCVFWF